MKRLGWGRVLLVAALVPVVALAFRVSWNALRDVARAIGADATAADMYPFVVDGLMALALVATLVLTGADRRMALRVLGGYTLASLVLNYVHGMQPSLHQSAHVGRVRMADWAPANWALVLLATSLPVGSIFFGSDLVAKVLHYRPESAGGSAADLQGDTAPGVAPVGPQTPDRVPDQTPDSMPDRASDDRADRAPVVSAGRVAEAPAQSGAGRVPQSDARSGGPSVGSTRSVGSVGSRPSGVTAPVGRPRRATGPVPQSAKAPVVQRTDEELLAAAREETADWPVEALTADRLRLAMRTGAEKSRWLRDALRAERDQAAAPAVDEAPAEAPAEPEVEAPAPVVGPVVPADVDQDAADAADEDQREDEGAA